MRVVILGSGVVGVASAWYLNQAGHEVTVIDREPGAALETSAANAGQISPGYAAPWAAPGVPFKLPGAPFTSWLTLLFLLSVLVLMAFDYPNGTYTIAALPIIGILLVIGWFGVRKRVAEIHSTAPVVEEDEEKQEIVFKPETAS